MFNLSEKRALVTGGSGGIGFAIAQTLAEAGAKVVITGTREAVLSENVTKLSGAGHGYLVANMADREAVAELAKQATETLGGFDILINNAGTAQDNISLRMKDDEWDRVLEINLRSVFALTQKLLRGMIKQKYGRIVNIGSVVGLMGNAGQANYSAAKAGLGGLTRSLAQEVAAKGVTVNCIAPGFVETPMTDKVLDANGEKLLQAIPCARFGQPKDIAACALYLSSAEAGYITGETITINGGLYMS